MQATSLIKPVKAWGSKSRNMIHEGTWHFYVDDYRFSNLLKSPFKLTDTHPKVCTELNISLYEDTPPALALSEIFKKRWISRYMQDHGISILVDLFVPRKMVDYNLLGVPSDWLAYSTRGTKDIEALQHDYDVACTYANTGNILFCVFGGGNKVADWCNTNRCVHVPYSSNKNVYSS